MRSANAERDNKMEISVGGLTSCGSESKCAEGWRKIPVMVFDRAGIQLIRMAENRNADSGEPFVSIIIPAYNEAHPLGGEHNGVGQIPRLVPWSHELILIIEKSSDDTLDWRAAAAGSGIERRRPRCPAWQGLRRRAGMLVPEGSSLFHGCGFLPRPRRRWMRFIGAFPQILTWMCSWANR